VKVICGFCARPPITITAVTPFTVVLAEMSIAG
jgi:hypothetical protein